MIMQSDLYVFRHGQLLKKPDVLEGTCYSGTINLYGLLTGDVLPVKPYNALARLIYTCQQVKNGRLSRSVRPDQTIQTALFNIQIKIINSSQTAKGNT